MNLTDRPKVPLGVCCDNCQCRTVISESSELIEPSATCIATINLDANTDVELADDEPADDKAEWVAAGNAPSTKRRDPTILPQRRRGAHLVDAQTSLERWRIETWSRFYSRRPWSPEILLPTGVISNIANKTYLQSIEALIEVGGWSRHRALRHGEELLSILQSVDECERDRRISDKQKMLDDRQERKRAAEAARDVKKADTKRRREEARLSRPKRPRASRARTSVGHVAAEIGPGKENNPLSSQGMPALPPTVSRGVVPFTPPRPPYSAQPSLSNLSPSSSCLLTPPMSFNAHVVLAPATPPATLTSPSQPIQPMLPPSPFPYNFRSSMGYAMLPPSSSVPVPSHALSPSVSLPPSSQLPVLSQAPSPTSSSPFWIPPFVAQHPLGPIQPRQGPLPYPLLPDKQGVWRYPTWPQ